MKKDALSKAFVVLTELMVTLRGPGGCPWDAEQTMDTIKMYLLEEAYEVLEAIERRNPEEVCGELGDLLFQIIFLARIAEESEAFDLQDVIEGITEKMTRRHPHVFGRVKVDSAEEVSKNWAEIKKAENGDADPYASLLHGVPSGLPALLRAHRLGERASKAGWDEPKGRVLWGRVEQDLDVLNQAVREGEEELIAEQIGDLVFDLASVARQRGLNAEHLLREANQKFLRQFSEKKETPKT